MVWEGRRFCVHHLEEAVQGDFQEAERDEEDLEQRGVCRKLFDGDVGYGNIFVVVVRERKGGDRGRGSWVLGDHDESYRKRT